jgi:hypothetical protein
MAFVLCSQKKDFVVVAAMEEAVGEAMEAVEEEDMGVAEEEAMEAVDMEAAEEVADLRVIMAAPTVEVAGGHMDTPTVGHTAGPSLTQSLVIGIDME